jgi:thioredoxin reductase
LGIVMTLQLAVIGGGIGGLSAASPDGRDIKLARETF